MSKAWSSKRTGRLRGSANASPRSMIERRLIDTGDRLKSLRADLLVADEQLAHFVAEADDARLRSLVSETSLAGREHRDAQRHAGAMRNYRNDLVGEVAQLEQLQDDLLDQLGGA